MSGDANGIVWAAYDQWAAIAHPCPRCGAQPDHACRNAITDGPRTIPCAARSRVGFLAAGGDPGPSRAYGMPADWVDDPHTDGP